MKITYEFVTGEVSGVEVDEHLGGMLLDLDRQQDNNDQKETRRHVSLDSMDYEGELFASAEDTEGEGGGIFKISTDGVQGSAVIVR